MYMGPLHVPLDKGNKSVGKQQKKYAGEACSRCCGCRSLQQQLVDCWSALLVKTFLLRSVRDMLFVFRV